MLCLRVLLPLTLVLTAFVLAVSWPANAAANPEATDKARKFLQTYTAQVRPLEIAAQRAWWKAATTGKEEEFKKREEAVNKLDAVLSDKEAFNQVKAIKEAGGIDDKVLKRAIDIVYLAYLEKQLDPALLKKMTALATSVEKTFGAYRAKVDGKEMTDSQVRKVLKESTLSERRRVVWEASKGVGGAVAGELHQLVKLRNEAAVKLGFKNYHALMLHLSEQNTNDLMKLFDDLDQLTRKPFKTAKAEIDLQLAKNCNVKVADLMPWHYHDPFFQEAPSVFSADLDKVYAGLDLVKLTADFYRGIGLPIEKVIEKSDLFESKTPGRNPHAFCIDITRGGDDVRVLANVVPNEYWMSTLLHEFGHSVYSSIYIPNKLPYVLRQDAHILATEGVAMMFERLSKRRAWLEGMGVKVAQHKEFDETAAKLQRYRLLIFSRWCQVMLRFEKGMYENPDQDLSKLWWDLVEKYQMLRRPPGRKAPDYASKIHIATVPVYYHNYMMGELFASQVHHAIARDVYQGADPDTVVYVGNKKVGAFMQKRVFDPGRTLGWNELTERATGVPLSAAAFAKDFKGK
jgi:peptidyl-dipeptidase A